MGSLPKYEPSATPPKLSLSWIPSKLPETPGLATPPLQTSVSVPFVWEEAPGKPRRSRKTPDSRAGGGDSKTSRSLDLPPRLMLNNDSKITNTPSPTTVLHGPYSGRSLSLSHTLSFSFRKPDEEGPAAGGTKQRLDGFKERDTRVVGGSFDLSYSADDCNPEGPTTGDHGTTVNITRSRIRRRRVNSFLSFSHTTSSNLWASIYGSLKQAAPWKRIQQKLRKMAP